MDDLCLPCLSWILLEMKLNLSSRALRRKISTDRSCISGRESHVGIDNGAPYVLSCWYQIQKAPWILTPPLRVSRWHRPASLWRALSPGWRVWDRLIHTLPTGQREILKLVTIILHEQFQKCSNPSCHHNSFKMKASSPVVPEDNTVVLNAPTRGCVFVFFPDSSVEIPT